MSVVWCAGRNFVQHAAELSNPVPSRPFFFLKAKSTATTEREVKLNFSRDIHYELEVAFEFGSHLQFSRCALALDLTDRSEQRIAKEAGLPWTRAKNFANALPISPWFNLKPTETEPWRNWTLSLRTHNSELQHGSVVDMLFSPLRLREELIQSVPVSDGDWLLTGTPAGTGPLKKDTTYLGELKDKETGTILLGTEWTFRDFP